MKRILSVHGMHMDLALIVAIRVVWDKVYFYLPNTRYDVDKESLPDTIENILQRWEDSKCKNLST